MALTRVDSTSTLDSTTASTIDLSDAVTAGQTNAIVELKNVSNYPVTAYRRDTGDSVWSQITLQPGDSESFTATLTAARTIDYYVAEGEIWAYVSYSWGTGLTTSLSVADVILWLQMNGYTISSTGNLTSAEVTLCLTNTTQKMTQAATQYALIAGKSLDTTYKNNVILHGAIAESLLAIHNQGTSTGLGQNRALVAVDVIEKHQAEFETALDKINKGMT